MGKKFFEEGAFNGVEADDAFAVAAMSESLVIVSLGNIPWPDNLGPKARKLGNHSPGTRVSGAVPETADVLVLLYTDYETRALLDIFTGSNSWDESKKNWYPYAHGFSGFKAEIERGWTNALEEGLLGYLLPVEIATKRVMLFKTELHPKNNGPHLPFIKLVQQLVMEVKPELVITTGTAGGVGKNLNCGDVVITDTARLHCKSQYSDYPAIYELSSQNVELKSGAAFNNKYVNYAAANFTRLSLPGLYECFQKLTGRAGYSFLKKNTSVPMLYVKGVNSVPGSQPMDIVSADYLTVDHEYNSEGLQALGIMNDTDDAFAAYAMNSLPASKRPKWLSIRNASEPQVVAPPFPAATSPSKVIDTLKGLAGPIYGVYQYCTTFNSVFACWGIIAGMTT